MKEVFMLVLSRKSGELIHIGSDIVITVLEVSGKFVRLGLEAPKNVSILRAEIKEQIERENKLASTKSVYGGLLKELGAKIRNRNRK
jgi:carbon storage regulator